ncbi:MAG: phosphatase PAP2 family protein [Ignavibacterium album]|uniref:phosphatase PAP2 family protein n=1 Tax=Ignavibacterium album TaxID=591197 RepID=UPI0026ED2CF1|nr:phosphatase PAP2 family protein [Ignavibacterium album]MBI5660797.1 phosphatase PAP2 family protein [Ignavibacterium album]
MKKYQTKTTIYFLFVLWLVLAFLFESSDLLLSDYLFNSRSTWAKFFEQYGEIPGLIVSLTGVYIYFTSNKLSSNSKKLIAYFFLMLISTAGLIYLNFLFTYHALGVNYNSQSKIVLLVIGSSIINFGLLFYVKSKIHFTYQQYFFSRVVLRMIIFGYLLTNLPLKFLWGRIRFRDFHGDFSNFSAWYIPNGFNGNDSFPSGHSAMAWILISLFILFTDKSILTRTAGKTILISYALIVSYSRIVIGAHFASDVLFGSMFMILTYVISKHFLYEEQMNKK